MLLLWWGGRSNDWGAFISRAKLWGFKGIYVSTGEEGGKVWWLDLDFVFALLGVREGGRDGRAVSATAP